MARPDRRSAPLDQPRQPGLARLPRPAVDSEAFGRWSEQVARFFGTARYLAIQTVIVLIWIAYNGVLTFQYEHHSSGKPFDPYPFILLNLVFSTQAAYAAPLILLAQNRQAARDRVQGEEDRLRSDRTKADTEYLAREVAALRIALGEVVTRDFLRGELDRLVGQRREPEPEGAAGAGPAGRP